MAFSLRRLLPSIRGARNSAGKSKRPKAARAALRRWRPSLDVLENRLAPAVVSATWLGGAGAWNVAANWDIGKVPNNNDGSGDTYSVFIDGGKAVNSSVNLNILTTVDNLTIDAGDSLTINDGQMLSINGSSIANAGSLVLNSTGAGASLRLFTDVTLSGGGTVTLSNFNNNAILGAFGGERLTNQDNTISGSGGIGLVGAVRLTNRATIIANQSVPLVIDPIGNSTSVNPGVINTGTLRADAGGTLILSDGNFQNFENAVGSGLIRANGGGAVIKVASSSITGGTVDDVGPSEVQLSNGSVTGGALNNSNAGILRTLAAAFPNTSTIGGAVSNAAGGQFIVDDGAVLALTGGAGNSYSNSGDILLNSTGSNTDLRMVGDVNISGGTMTFSSGTTNRIVGATAADQLTLSSVTVNGPGTLTNDVGRTLTLFFSAINAPLVNNGALIARATGNTIGGSFTTGPGSILRVQGQTAFSSGILTIAPAFTNNGTIELTSVVGGDTNANATLNVTGTLTNPAGHTIDVLQGVGAFGGDRFLNAPLDNQGTINISSDSGLSVNPPSALNAQHMNSGTINVTDGNLTVTQSGTSPTFANPGTVNVSAGQTFDISGGTFTSFSGGTLLEGTYNLGGTFQFNGAAITTNQATIVLDGAGGGLARIVNESSADALANFSTNTAGASFTIQNGRNFTTAGALANAGNLTVGSGSSLTVGGGGNYTQTSGTTTVDGTLSAALVDIQAGLLRGSGTVTGNVANAGQVAPGTSPGVLINDGNYSQTANAGLNIEIGGLTLGSQFDQLQVNGTVTLDGTLNISLLNGFVPTPGDQFVILNKTSGGVISGNFTNQTEGTVFSVGSARFQITYRGGTSNDVMLTAIALADLAITVVDDAPDPVLAGNNLTYTIHFINNGPDTGAGIFVTDTLPAGTTFVSVTPDAGWTSSTPAVGGMGTVTFSKASVAAGETAVLTIVVKVDPSVAAATVITDTATAATTNPNTIDLTPGNNSRQTTTTVQTQADVGVTNVAPATVAAGADLTYTITVANNGPSDAQSVALADLLPSGMTFVSQNQTTGPAFSLNHTGNQINDSVATLPAGVSATINVVAHVPGATRGTTVFSDTATVSTATTDLTSGNDSSKADTTVIGATHFTVAAPATTTAGTTFNFTVTALDQFNNPAGAYDGTVHFTSSDGAAVLPADVALANGGGIFSATFKTAGSQTLTATDTTVGSITGTSNTVAVSAAAATHFTVSAPSSATAGSAFNFTVTALDPFNNTADGYTGAVHFSGSDGAAVLPSNSTLTNGVGTFSATLKTAGTQTLTATDTTVGSITGTSNTITVSAAAASHVAVSGPASATAGSAFSLTVTALDPFNNTATVYGGTVHFTSSDGQAVLPADSTLTNGVRSFSATLKTAGNQSLTATDTVTSSITGTSTTIAVSPAAATHFTLIGPGSAAPGIPFNFTVTAQDPFNNTATGYGGAVHFTSSDIAAVLPADSTLTNGAGTFAATLVTLGDQTLTATDTVASSITGTSNAITVNATAATHFFVVGPSSATAGSAFNFTVTAQTVSNTTATGYTGTVHFTSTDGQALLPADATLTNGVGTFSVTLKTAGNQTLTATDTASSSITGTSNTITVSAAVATHFTVSTPASATAGSAFSFTATAQDPFNNTATGYSGTVHFTSSDGQAVMPTDSTLTNGVGTFSATLKTAGSQSVTATDTATSSITGTSNAIAVSAAAATHFTVSAPGSATAGGAFNFTVRGQDPFNNTATGYGGVVHFTSSDGQAVLPADSTLTNGSGTFSATLKTAGNQTLTATDTVTSSISGTSNTIAVSAVAATHFTVSAPSSAAAGGAFNFTVTAQDPFNNTATSYTGTVTFSSSDGQATLPADGALSNGVGTFSATLRTAGGQTLTATDTVTSSITGTSNSVAVSAAAATQFIVSAPASATAGAAFSFTVTAEDAFNNTATSYTGTVHFTSSDGQSLLPADSSLTNGVGTFSATLKTAGSQTLTGTDTANSSITGTSNAVSVSAAAATHFTVSAPSSATAGSAFNFTVTALDQFNNIDAGYTGAVHFTSSDGQSVLPADSSLTNGVGTFSATLKTAGSQTLTGTDTATSSITGTSNAIAVSAAAATHFTVSAPASATAGTAFSFTVTALDPFNNTATGYTGTAHFTSSGGQAVLPADSTLTNGAGTFSATLQTAGNQTITATDTLTSSITGTSNSINVSGTVGHPPITLTGQAVSGFELTALTNVLFAQFTQGSNAQGPGAFSATIGWGDGTTTAGTVLQSSPGGAYTVLGSHTFGDEARFALTISVTDGVVSATGPATATILEELLPDGTRGTPTQRYVSEVYRDLLHRQVDAPALGAWTQALNQGVSRSQVATLIQNAAGHEYQTVEVEQVYDQFLHRGADPAGLTSAVNFLVAGGTVEQLGAALAGSPEYLQNAGGTDDGFLNALYRDVLGRTPDTDGSTFWHGVLSRGVSLDQVARNFLASNEYRRDLSQQFYQQFLGRPADPVGGGAVFNFLSAGVRDEVMIAALVGSQEFFNKTLA